MTKPRDDDEAPDHPLVKDHRWTLSIKEEDETRVLYEAVPPEQKEYLCPDCGSKGWPKDKGFGTKPYVDLKRSGRRVELLVFRRRFDCSNPNCKTDSFSEKLPELNKRHLTRDLTTEVIGLLLRSQKTFASVAAEYHVGEQVLRNVEKDYVAEQDLLRRKYYRLRMPHQIGIHSPRIARKARCLLANVSAATLLEIVPSQKDQEIVGAFEELFDKSQFKNVDLVVMAINSTYRELVKVLSPRAKIVVPRFEVEAIVNSHLKAMVQQIWKGTRLTKERSESAERLLRTNPAELTNPKKRELEKLLNQSELLKAAYKIKTDFLEILTRETEEQKLARYKEWLEAVTSLLRIAPSPPLRDLIEWGNPILEGLTFHVPNYLAPVERFIDRLKESAYSFETLRGRLLYGAGLSMQERVRKFNTRFMSDEDSDDEEFYENQGPSIQRLINYLEAEFSSQPLKITADEN